MHKFLKPKISDATLNESCFTGLPRAEGIVPIYEVYPEGISRRSALTWLRIGRAVWHWRRRTEPVDCPPRLFLFSVQTPPQSRPDPSAAAQRLSCSAHLLGLFLQVCASTLAPCWTTLPHRVSAPNCLLNSCTACWRPVRCCLFVICELRLSRAFAPRSFTHAATTFCHFEKRNVLESSRRCG